MAQKNWTAVWFKISDITHKKILQQNDNSPLLNVLVVTKLHTYILSSMVYNTALHT